MLVGCIEGECHRSVVLHAMRLICDAPSLLEVALHERAMAAALKRVRVRDAEVRALALEVMSTLGSAPMEEVEAAADMLERDFGVAADIWSLPSVNELAREGNDAVRWNRLHPTDAPRVPYLTAQLSEAKGPFIAATDYLKAHTEQLREFIPGRFTALGTDGFGRSDTRRQLRQHFEVSREHIVLATLTALVDEGEVDVSIVERAISELEINTDKPNPMRL